MKTVLVAIDPQHDAGQTLARAAQLSSQHQATVHILHVIDDTGVGELGMRDAVEQRTRETLDAFVQAAGFGATPTLQIEFGVPHRCVAHAAEALAADVIVIGPGQPSTMMQRMFGSTADRIVRTATAPVLVVRNESAQRYRHVAVALDFSPLSEAALVAARTLAPEARIELVHAYEIPLPFEQAMLRSGVRPEDAEHFRQSKLNDCHDQLLDLARRHALEKHTIILRGAPGAALVELSRSGRADLIALGTQGRNAAAQALLGSVARRLLLGAECDVLVVAPGLLMPSASSGTEGEP